MTGVISNPPMIDRLPDGLERLAELSYNLWWTWHPEAVDLFRRISPELWEETDQNPVRLLVTVSPTRLRELAHNAPFLRSLERVCEAFDTYMEKPGWFDRNFGADSWGCVAYLSAEYGLAACLPIYAGGLGVLAGDHLKSASDLGVPLVGVGLLYRHRFRQCLTSNGHQSELYSDSNVECMPIQLCRAEDAQPVTVEIPCSSHAVRAQLWRVQVGRVPLFLLDADVPTNSEHDRRITNRLYTSNPAKRIRQEIALGIGGMRALESLGLQPTVVHMNEGHCAFAALERIRILMSRQGLSFESAREIVSSTNVFTTHTSVGAAIDRFAPSLVDECLQAYPSLLGLTRHDFLALGRHQPWDDEPFCMPVLALRLSAHANGVSKLHGETSRKLWSCVWSSQPDGRQPITSVTNGVHLRSWMCCSPVASLLDRYLGEEWHEDATPARFWQKVDEIPDSEIWQAHQQARWRLIQETRRRLSAQLAEQGAPYREMARANGLLDPGALTIAFSRRFTAYKRPTLIFRDPRKLIRILTNENRRVQIIFAGKAHPKDESGKHLIGQVAGFVRQTGLNDRIIFIGDYDMNISRYLVQGADIWLNTPRRPLEACGTSGMKAAANGVLNISTLDGWWPEAYEPDIGWAFGDGEPHENHDDEDAARLYDLLENEAIPLFYDRDREGFPREWIRRMKASIKAICPSFNSNRMLREYCDRNYAPSSKLFARLCPGGVAASVPLPHQDTRYSGQETLPGMAHQVPNWTFESFESSSS